jgi:hypothetical protein
VSATRGSASKTFDGWGITVSRSRPLAATSSDFEVESRPMEDLQLLKIPVGVFAILAFLIAVFWITG